MVLGPELVAALGHIANGRERVALLSRLDGGSCYLKILLQAFRHLSFDAAEEEIVDTHIIAHTRSLGWRF